MSDIHELLYMCGILDILLRMAHGSTGKSLRETSIM